MTIEDNGKGISTEELSDLGSSFGYRLIHVLKDQLRGSISVDGDLGTKVVLKVRKYEKAK